KLGLGAKVCLLEASYLVQHEGVHGGAFRWWRCHARMGTGSNCSTDDGAGHLFFFRSAVRVATVAQVTDYVVLLRGVNVGGRTLKMADVRAALAEGAFPGARTVLASGNVLLASERDAATVGTAVEQILTERFGYQAWVLVRSTAQLAQVGGRLPVRDRRGHPPPVRGVLPQRRGARGAAGRAHRDRPGRAHRARGCGALLADAPGQQPGHTGVQGAGAGAVHRRRHHPEPAHAAPPAALSWSRARWCRRRRRW